MTEEQANKTRCPQMIFSIRKDPSANVGIFGVYELDYCYCIASECQMWQWKHDEYKSKFEGYCGLAGKE
jgi:hypothetical protein